MDMPAFRSDECSDEVPRVCSSADRGVIFEGFVFGSGIP